jgi:8-amino-7-oxononanoate synthase
MRDFTSSLYLGMQHPRASLLPWNALTLGAPAALRDPPRATALAADVAELQGCQAGTLLPSTLHLFWDLFRVLAQDPVAILRDEHLYPIARWGTERAAGAGTLVRAFPHHDGDSVARLARHIARRKLRPVIVTDGFCPACGEVAPIDVYDDIARRFDGFVVVDDTQALGILGAAPCAANPYGKGGGGALRWHGVRSARVVVGSSLAKAFGAPLAVLAGGRELIERFRQHAETQVHCSPPSVAVIHAARRALQINRQEGERLRASVRELVGALRAQMAHAGFRAGGGLPFPVQCFQSRHGLSVEMFQRELLAHGVRTLIVRACRGHKAGLTLIVTARHHIADIEYVARVARTLRRDSRITLAGAA